jgi:1,2-diacylglycerol 3-alpha-glucosyltransferase
MFTNTYLPHVGGVARSVSTFAGELRKMGQQVLVVAPTFEKKSNNQEDEKHVLRVPAIQNFNGSDFSVRIPLPGIIEEKIKKFQPEIIHSHHPFLLGDAALRTARRHDLPIIFTHHTRYEQYTHYVPFDSEVLKRFVIRLSTEYANLCSWVIAPSRSIRYLLRKRGVMSPVAVLPTGINLDYFKNGNGQTFRRKFNIADKRKIVGHIGRLAREKNLPYLATAVADFMEKDRESCFVVAGTGDAEEEIRGIFSHHHLTDRLIMPGILPGNQLADCYKAMDIFVFASKSETQGLVLMEAMAAGVPVVAVRASGVSDVVEDGRNGRILPANATVNQFSTAIANAFAARKIASWRPKTLQTAEQFSRENCTTRLLELYETVIREGNGTRAAMDMLDVIRKNLKAEWELIQEKTAAMRQSMSEE